MSFSPAVDLPREPSGQRTWFVVSHKGLLVREDGERTLLPDQDVETQLRLDPARALYLGELDGTDAFACALPEKQGSPGGFGVQALRALHGALGEERWGVAGRAAQLVEWDSTHRFCGRCAAPTQRVTGERCKRCPACNLTAYPRIAPAIIVLIRRGEEALLARGARFPAAFYSTLAGFSEPGETLEETLAREVREEVGIEVKNPRYFGSQSWPFPHSLMVGFTAEWASGDLHIDPGEIVDASWYRADALPMIPPRLSIARRLIDAWVSEVAKPG